jgi:phosphoglycerate dehydrogenase-like enzyme
MMKPIVAIIDWQSSPHGDAESTVEREVIGELGEVRRYLATETGQFPDEAFAANVHLVWHNTPYPAATIARLTDCRAIIRNGVGVDSIDLAAAAKRGIPVCNVPDYGTEEVADHALALTLALCRQILPLDGEAKKLLWHIPVAERMRRLRALQFGIVGLGRIGTAAALRAKAFNFRVAFHDPYRPAGTEKSIGITRAGSLEELLRASDVVSVHCPLTSETHHLIAEREIALMPRGSFLVNTARGAIVKKTAVLAALRSGHLGGAGLDVIEDEPLRSAEEAATPNLIATCHAAFCSVEAKLEMRRSSARIAAQVLRGEKPDNRVN